MNSQPCIYCQENSKSHSFIKLNNKQDTINKYNSITTFYTKVSDAELYNKPDTIIYHIEETLKYNKINYDKEWIWIINLDDAEFKHYIEFNTVRELSNWINKESKQLCNKLKEINIINSNFMINGFIGLSKQFMPNHIKINII